jgi:hypothetical protein
MQPRLAHGSTVIRRLLLNVMTPSWRTGRTIFWRLQLQNMELRQRGKQLADRWETQMLEAARAFQIGHAMMAFAAAG